MTAVYDRYELKGTTIHMWGRDTKPRREFFQHTSSPAQPIRTPRAVCVIKDKNTI